MEVPIHINRRTKRRMIETALNTVNLLILFWIFLLLLVQLPLVQNMVKDRVLSWVNDHFNQNIQVGKVQLDIPSGITMSFAIYDHKDSLLASCEKLSIAPQNLFSLMFGNDLKIRSIEADGFHLNITQYAGETKNNFQQFIDKFKSTTKSSSTFNLFIHKVLLKQLSLKIDISSLYANLTMDKLQVRMDSLDLENKYFNFRTVLMDNPNLVICQHASTDATSNNMGLEESSSLINSCIIGPAFNFSFINCTNGKLEVFIPSSAFHYSLSAINFSSTYSYFSSDLTRLDFLTLNAKGERNFRIKNLQLNGFNQNKHQLSLDNLDIKTNHSQLQLKGYVTSLSTPLGAKKYSDWSTSLTINKAELYPDDLEEFDPTNKVVQYFTEGLHVPLVFSGKVAGTPNSLIFNGIKLIYGNALSLDGTGQVRHLMSGKDALINARLKSAKLESKFGYELLRNPSIPKSYLQLGTIRFNGNFDGFISDFVAYGDFNTNLGSIHSDIKLSLRKNITQSSYSGSVSSKSFDLGKLLNSKDIGKITAYAAITEGTGLTKESINAKLKANIQLVEINQQSIQSANFIGTLKSDELSGEVVITDPNINASMSGAVSFKNSGISVQINSSFANFELGFLNSKLTGKRFKGNFETKFNSNENVSWEGFIKGDKIFYEDSLNAVNINQVFLTQKFQQGLRHISLQSDVMDAKLIGKFNESSLVEDLLIYLNKKYKGFLDNILKIEDKKPNDVLLNANLYIQDVDKLHSIFNYPFLPKYLDVDFAIDTKKDIFEIRSNRFDLFYKNFLASKLSINLNCSNLLKSGITFDYLMDKDKKRIGNGKILLSLDGETGNLHVQLFDEVNKRILTNFINDFTISKNDIKISLRSDNLYFNDTRWHINKLNAVQINKGNFSISNFELSDSLHFLSIRDYDGKGLVLSVDGFSMDIVNDLLQSHTVHFKGIIGTEIIIPSLKTFQDTRGTIDITDFTLNKSHFGPLRISFDVPDARQPWNLKLMSKSLNQDLMGIGSINVPVFKPYPYHPFDFDVNFDLRNFPLSFIENFIDAVSGSTGGGVGNIRFYSEKNKLNIEGNVLIQKATTHIDYLNVPINIINQPIRFEKHAIVVDSIQIFDKLGNEVKVNGKVYHTNLKDWLMDITVESKKALVLDTDKSNGEAYYGYGIGKVDAHFSGPVSMMQMDLSLVSAKGTRLYLPMTNNSITERADFVQFINRGENKIDITKVPLERKELTGINVNMQLSLTDDAEVSVIFDEVTGDILKGKGRGNLLIKSLRNGVFNVNGDFELEQGQYLFTLYNFVNKPFTLTRGGVATWTGDPLNANINIEAVYEGLQAAPFLLLQEYLGENQDLTEEAKRRTTVKLKMLLTGSLLKPNISFDLELPDLTGNLRNYADNKIQYLKLNQDQFNQQIFGLLVLGTFLNNSNPWEGGLIGNLGTTTINTMSEMLSNQFSLFVTNLLNNAFDDVNFISGIDFNIGYDIDNTKIAGTNLNESEVVLSLKQRLWNDQIIVTLGGNYKSNSQILGNSYFNPESVIEWNTPVQGLKMRVYYRGDESIEGIKHKIGAGISLRKEFDRIFEGKPQ